MQTFSTIVDLVKGIAWPVVALVFVAIYRTEIGALLARLRKAGPAGVELEPIAQQQVVESVSSPATINEGDLPHLTSPFLEVEQNILSLTNEIQEPYKIPRLVREVTMLRLQLHFEKIYNAIFGSQIQLLKRLNEMGVITNNDAEELYEKFENQYKDFYSTYSYNQWIRFLLSNILVEDLTGRFEITDTGREFLKYIVDRRLAENKPW